MADFTIGKLARALGVRPDTIRYYERNGLLPAPSRSAAGYRTYGPTDLERVRFIRKAQHLGFTLREIATLLDLRASDKARSTDVLAITEQKIAETGARMADLNRIKTALTSLAAECTVDIPAADCPIIAHLASISVPAGAAVPPTDSREH